MADLLEIYKTVRDKLGELGSPWDIPPHQVWRLAAAVGEEAVQHVDSDVAQVAHRTYAGTVLLFTDTRIVRASMANGPGQPQPHDARTYSVTLSTWRRADLQTLDFLPDQEQWRNSDMEWSGLATGEANGIPGDLEVTLHYARREPMTLPLRADYRQGSRRAMLFGFLPALLQDLSIP
jgi:hypothetical protein